MAVYNSNDEFCKSQVGDKKCFFCCNRSPDAYWQSGGLFVVCRWCAPKMLAGLLADSIFKDQNREGLTSLGRETLKEFERHFWRAAMINVDRSFNEPRSLEEREKADARIQDRIARLENLQNLVGKDLELDENQQTEYELLKDLFSSCSAWKISRKKFQK